MAYNGTAKQRRAQAILNHGFALKRIFPKTEHDSPVALCKSVHRLEVEAHRLAEDQCNRQLPEGYVEKKEASILRRLDKILGFSAAGIPVFLNGDPRGYALKIESEYVHAHGLDIHRDMGGYGIICPEY